MKTAGKLLVLTLAVVTTPALAGTLKCPPDSVQVGPTCADKYEASVWQIDPSNNALVQKVQAGTVTLADLTAGGATQVSAAMGPRPLHPDGICAPSFPASFDITGNWTKPLYAVSIAGVPPTACVSWFQAVQACALSGKRLLRNEEWQRAAAGTPDPGSADDRSTTCVTDSPAPVDTGSRAKCRSSWGVFDMVGNVDEWVADWSDLATNCTDWTTTAGIAGGDESCFGGPGNTGNAGDTGRFSSIPGASLRGGAWFDFTFAGVFAVNARFVPSASTGFIGFRCAR